MAAIALVVTGRVRSQMQSRRFAHQSLTDLIASSTQIYWRAVWDIDLSDLGIPASVIAVTDGTVIGKVSSRFGNRQLIEKTC